MLDLLLLSRLHISRAARCSDTIERKAGPYALFLGNQWAFLHQMAGEVVDAAFGEVLATELACLRVSSPQAIQSVIKSFVVACRKE